MTVLDVEYDLMSYCLKYRGKWWANHFFKNKEVNTLYCYLRIQDLETVFSTLGDGGESARKLNFFETAPLVVKDLNTEWSDSAKGYVP